jgi:hypothetical protein
LSVKAVAVFAGVLIIQTLFTSICFVKAQRQVLLNSQTGRQRSPGKTVQ